MYMGKGDGKQFNLEVKLRKPSETGWQSQTRWFSAASRPALGTHVSTDG